MRRHRNSSNHQNHLVPQRQPNNDETSSEARKKKEQARKMALCELRKTEPKDTKLRLVRLLRILELEFGPTGDRINNVLTKYEASQLFVEILADELAFHASIRRKNRKPSTFSTLILHLFWGDQQEINGCQVGYMRHTK